MPDKAEEIEVPSFIVKGDVFSFFQQINHVEKRFFESVIQVRAVVGEPSHLRSHNTNNGGTAILL